MAQIPVERKSGSPWAWIVGLIALAALVWIVVAVVNDNDDQVAEAPGSYTDTTGEAEPGLAENGPMGQTELGVPDTTASVAGTVTNYTSLTTATDPSDFINKKVELHDLRVDRVVGDSTFVIMRSNDGTQNMLLVQMRQMGESRNPNELPIGVDGRYDINEGDVVDVYGTVQRFSDSTYVDDVGLSPDEATRLNHEGLYVAADRLDYADSNSAQP